MQLLLLKVIEVKREWKTCQTGEGAYVLVNAVFILLVTVFVYYVSQVSTDGLADLWSPRTNFFNT